MTSVLVLAGVIVLLILYRTGRLSALLHATAGTKTLVGGGA